MLGDARAENGVVAMVGLYSSHETEVEVACVQLPTITNHRKPKGIDPLTFGPLCACNLEPLQGPEVRKTCDLATLHLQRQD